MAKLGLSLIAVLSLIVMPLAAQEAVNSRHVLLPSELSLYTLGDEKFYLAGFAHNFEMMDDSSVSVSFNLTDGNENIRIEYAGMLPDLIDDGSATIVRGFLRNSILIADTILLLLPNKCEQLFPKAVIAELKWLGFSECDEALS